MSRIEGVEVTLSRVELAKPFRIALGESRVAETLYARIELSDGTVGWGEAAPAPRVTGETPGAALEAARMASRLLVGLDAWRLGEALRLLDKALFAAPAARAALVNALMDAVARSHGLPLCALIGGCRRGDRYTFVTVSLGSPEEMAREALGWFSRGFRRLKVKLGGPWRLDVERVRAVREAVGWGVDLIVDVNQAWSYADAIAALGELARLDVMLVEQPLPARDHEGIARLSSVSPIPLAVDESVLDGRDLVRLYSLGFRGVVNVKVSRVGGVDRAAELLRLAEELSLGGMVGCMLETGLALRASLHAASVAPSNIVHDLDAALLIGRDPTGCIEYGEGGLLPGVGGVGVGCEPRLPV